MGLGFPVFFVTFGVRQNRSKSRSDAAAAAVVASSSFQVERWVGPKGLIQSIDVLEAIRCLGPTHKHDGGRV